MYLKINKKQTTTLMRLIRTTILLLLLAATAKAQFGVEKDYETGKKGFLNQKEGYVLIPFEYDDIQPWADDTLVTVQKGPYKGILTKRNQVIVPVQFEELDLSKEAGRSLGYAGVKTGGKWGLYSLNGKEALPAKFEYVQAVQSDILVGRVAGDTLLWFYDENGQLLFKMAGKTARPGYDQHTAEIIRADHSRHFIDKQGKSVFPDRFIGPRWTDGRMVICSTVSPDGRSGDAGLLSWEGDTILPCTHLNIEPAGEGLFFVKTRASMMGLADEYGRFVIPLAKGVLSRIGDQPSDAFLLRGDGYYSDKVYDVKGNLLLEDCRVRTVRCHSAFKNKIPEQRLDRYFSATIEYMQATGLFHADGRPILPIQYKDIEYCSDRHPLIVLFFGKSIAMGWDGTPLLSGKYKRLAFTPDPQLLIGVPDTSEMYGFIHLDKEQEADFIYEGIGQIPLSDYYQVKENGQYYLHAPSGKRINQEGFVTISEPWRRAFQAWRARNMPGKLVATGSRIGHRGYGPKPWVGFDENGIAHDFEPPNLVEEHFKVEETPPSKKEESLPKPKVERTPRPGEEEVFDAVDQKPEFPGGEEALLKYLAEQMKYPVIAQENGVEGQVVVTFIVEKDGSITQPQIIRDIGGGCGLEALRLVRAMPRWEPGKVNGEPVRVAFTLPVRFELE